MSPANLQPVSEEEQSFLLLTFSNPEPTHKFFSSLPDEFLLKFGYTYYDVMDGAELWNPRTTWFNPSAFNKERLLRELNHYVKTSR